MRIVTDKIQFSALSNRQTALILISQPCDNNSGKYAVISSSDDSSVFMIAYICQSKALSDYGELITDTLFKTRITDEMKGVCSETAKKILETDGIIYALWLYVYDMPQESEPSLVPATLIMYSYIQFIRHMHIKRKFFSNTISAETEQGFFNAVSILEKTAALIKCELSTDEYLIFMENADTDKVYSLTELLNELPEITEPNNFRKNILDEISKTVVRIKDAFRKKEYKTVRKLAYDIHNLPETLRTMDDWRKTPNKEI